METIYKLFWDLLKKYENFIKYCFIGVTGASIDFIVFWLLTQKAGMNFPLGSFNWNGNPITITAIQLANFISVTFGITNNFILNAVFNFKVRDKLVTRYLKFYSVGIVGLGITALMLVIFVDALHYNKYIVKFLSIFIVTIVQFSLNKLVSFKK